MGLSNNLGKLSNMITSTGSAVSMSGTLTLATTQYVGNLQFGTSSTATLGYDAGTGAMSFNIGAGAASSSAYYKFLADGSPIVTFLKGGNVGIGNAAPSYTLDVSGTGRYNGSATTMLSVISSGTASGLELKNTGGTASNWIIQSDGGAVAGQAALRFYSITASAYRMSIDGSGNVGIGTSSPVDYTGYRSLHIMGANSTSSAILYLTNSTSSIRGLFFAEGTASRVTLGSQSNHDLTFVTNDTERMRITSGGDINMNATSGNKLVTVKGQTGNGYYGEVRMGNADHSAGIIGRHISSGNANLEFWTEAYSAGGYTLKMTITASGNIGAPSGTNIYNASDVRLKQNITKIEDGLDKIKALNPVKFNWLDGFEESEDGKDMLGFIAQEVQDIIPEAVESFGNNSLKVGDVVVDNPLRVNEKFIIPVLVKAIQELSSQNQDLKSRLDKAGL